MKAKLHIYPAEENFVRQSKVAGDKHELIHQTEHASCYRKGWKFFFFNFGYQCNRKGSDKLK